LVPRATGAQASRQGWPYYTPMHPQAARTPPYIVGPALAAGLTAALGADWSGQWLACSRLYSLTFVSMISNSAYY